MDRNDIIRMAREAGFAHSWSEAAGEALERFAALVAAAEREACAKIRGERMNLREAAQQALEALIWTTGSKDFSEGGQAREGALNLLFPAITALRAALAENQSEDALGMIEPVAYIHETGFLVRNPTATLTAGMKLYTAPPKREPLTDCGEAGHDEGRCGNANCITPPKREPLTDEEISKIFIYCGRDKETFARAIERAHGIGGEK